MVFRFLLQATLKMLFSELFNIFPINLHVVSIDCYFHSSSFGYSNAQSFKSIDVPGIAEVEVFVRNDMMKLLEKRCLQKNVRILDDEKLHFFGIFDTDHENFRFVAGDKSLIIELVKFVNTKLIECGNSYFKPGKQRKVLLHNGDVCQLSMGLFFARKEQTLQIAVCRSGSRSTNQEEIMEDLFEKKLKPLLESKSLSNLKQNRAINIDILKIINKDNQIRAEVVCVFCPNEKERTFTIQCNSPSNSNHYYWNTSNFKKHVDLHKKQAVQLDGDGTELDDSHQNDETDNHMDALNHLPSDEGEEYPVPSQKRRRKANNGVKQKPKRNQALQNMKNGMSPSPLMKKNITKIYFCSKCQRKIW